MRGAENPFLSLPGSATLDSLPKENVGPFHFHSSSPPAPPKQHSPSPTSHPCRDRPERECSSPGSRHKCSPCLTHPAAHWFAVNIRGPAIQPLCQKISNCHSQLEPFLCTSRTNRVASSHSQGTCYTNTQEPQYRATAVCTTPKEK